MSKVVVAMSGGVDSSVAAALLKEQGYDVIGMMLRLWSEPGKEESNRCCTPDSMAQARRVAAKLDIPFYVIDAKDVFHDTVVQYFLDGYGRGETPNPCLICNRQIRWTFLLDHALALGADYMATGHYLRIKKEESGKIQLLRAVDKSKDQSYVLHVLTQEKLRHALFPVGDYPKTEIRAIAERHGGDARLAFGRERRFDRGVGPVEPLVDFLLPSIRGDALMKVSLRVHEADADERHAEVARFLAVIAGQDAEAARIDRQRLVQRELRGKVRHRSAAQVAAFVREPRVVRRPHLVQP